MPWLRNGSSSPALISSSRILVASADAVVADILARHLREWGYTPVQVSGGRAAVCRLTETNAPGIAILDASLPELSGEEVSAAVCNSNRNRHIWKLMVCDRVDPATIANAAAAGIDDLVVKPVDSTDLRVRIGVAQRVLGLMQQLDSLTDATLFHASHDRLTGLLNRDSILRLLFVETDRAQRLNTPLTLVLLDLDSFSRINADHGYQAGDRILQELARRFQRYLRSYDLIGRCGEDEFLIALPGCTSEEAYTLAQRVKRSILYRPFPVGDNMLTLTASAGISHSRGRSPLVVLREAEQALANAKLSGRNCERQFAHLEPKQGFETPDRTLRMKLTKH